MPAQLAACFANCYITTTTTDVTLHITRIVYHNSRDTSAKRPCSLSRPQWKARYGAFADPTIRLRLKGHGWLQSKAGDVHVLEQFGSCYLSVRSR